jgi:hypothetical protein
LTTINFSSSVRAKAQIKNKYIEIPKLETNSNLVKLSSKNIIGIIATKRATKNAKKHLKTISYKK